MGRRCGGGYHRSGCGHGGGGSPHRALPNNLVYTYTPEAMNALQANIAKMVAEGKAHYTDGRAGSLQYNKDQQQWHEYHGWGQDGNMIRPDGGVNFNDETPYGKHSHTIRDRDFNIRRERPEGS